MYSNLVYQPKVKIMPSEEYGNIMAESAAKSNAFMPTNQN